MRQYEQSEGQGHQGSVEFSKISEKFRAEISDLQTMFHQLYADCLTRRPIVTSYKQERKSDEVLRTIKMLQKSNEREKDDIIYSHEVFIRDLVAKCRSDITEAEEELRKVFLCQIFGN